MMIMKTINNSDLKMIIEEVLHDIMNENAKILPQFEDAGKVRSLGMKETILPFDTKEKDESGAFIAEDLSK
ncbi:MAG TPA: hypothetical protein PKX11_06420, partial [Methanospirillum sp.]|nr:hypothetical protein [Methanospirillum sp.]